MRQGRESPTQGHSAFHPGRAGGARQGGTGQGTADAPGRDRGPEGPGRSRPSRGAGKHALARTDADPIWPDARIRVRLLSRWRADHGDRSLADAELGHPYAALRRCTSVELRRVRLARADPRFRRQRLRRDDAGTMGVGCEAPGGERRNRRPRKRLLAQGQGRQLCLPRSARTGRR